MPEEKIETPKTGRRILLYFVGMAVIFSAGYIPPWLRLRDQTALREKAEHALTVTRILKDLGSAAAIARRSPKLSVRNLLHCSGLAMKSLPCLRGMIPPRRNDYPTCMLRFEKRWGFEA
jgi:hypothetical protein